MKNKNAAAGNPDDDLYRSLSQVTSRETARAQVDALFGGTSVENRKKDRESLEKLFVQTPAAQVQHTNLLAGVKEKKSSKCALASLDAPKCESTGPVGSDWLQKFQNSPLHEEAAALEKQDILHDLKRDARNLAESAETDDFNKEGDHIRISKRALELRLRLAELGGQEKTSGVESIAPHVDAFFEKLAAPDEAQRRYPELLKVAQTPALNLKNRPKNQTPVQAAISGGSA